MKLKCIEIQGFKSFDDKTVVNFNDTITGIVGPNGCGKSNIVDAIRWVMGEQSAKHLRGQSMEDIIFAGSQSRSPNSLASVEFTFITDGQCPPEYADMKEISIGRKLYRSGESEYYINKQPTRLKDVTDLFLGTGVGSKAYSIIEQGRVGKVITAKAEDRRGIIEEAAGISKFKIRKEAALRRMESTQQNLLRLNDIVSELETQLVSLERQAKKAERFRAVKDELMALDLKVAAIEYSALDTNQKEIFQKIKELDEVEVSLSSSLSQNEADAEEERLKLVEVENDLSGLQQSLFELNNLLNLAESNIHVKKEQEAHCESEINQCEQNLRDFIEHVQKIKDELLQLNDKFIHSDLDCEELKFIVTGLESDLEQLNRKSQDLFSVIEAARQSYHESGSKLTQITANREHLSARLEELKNEKVTQEAALTTLTARYDEVESLLKGTREDLSEVKQLKLSLSERTGQLLEDLKSEEQKNETEQNELAHIKEELLKKKSRLQSLEELERNFEGYQQGARHILQRKKSGDIQHALDSVADVIEAEPEYEGAISALLGERIQYLVVESSSEGVACAEYLKTSQAGRGSFIPIKIPNLDLEVFDHSTTSWTDNTFGTNETAEGVRGYLRQFVKTKPGFEKLMHVLFGDVLVTDNLKNALDVWSKYKKSVVTLDGELISIEGILTGGTLENTSVALLEKKREIKDLHQVVSGLVDQVKAREETCFDLKKKIKTLQAEIETMKSTSHQEEVKIATREQDIFHAGTEVENINSRRGQVSQQIFALTESMEHIEDQLKDFEQQEEASKKIYAESGQFIEGKKSDEENYRRDLALLQEKLTNEKIRLAQSQEQKNHLVQEEERLIAEASKVENQISEQQEKKNLVTKKKLFLEDRIRFQEKNIQKVITEKDGVQAVYQEKKNAYEVMNHSLREREIQLKESRLKYNHAKDELNQNTLQLTEVRSHLTRLKEITLERYQQILSEIYQNYLPIEGEEFNAEESKQRADELRQKLSGIGGVNLAAIDELNELKARYDFLNNQKIDLESSLNALDKAIQKINLTTKTRFKETFDLINEKFTKLFPRLFKGGQAYLQLTDPENILETGVDIIAQPPGKKLQSISLLSGGEQALTAVSLLFAIFLIKPAPFCLLDEVDAPLDDANVDRYNEIVKDMSQRTQFIIITHNKRTMQITNNLYGVTMEEPGVSKLVSVQIS